MCVDQTRERDQTVRLDGLVGLVREGLTILMVEQNAVRAIEAADRGYVMRTGEIVAAGSAVDLGGKQGLLSSYLGSDR